MTKSAQKNDAHKSLFQKIFKGRTVESLTFPAVLFVIQITILVLYYVFVDYGEPYDSTNHTGDHGNSVPYFYKNYSDIAIMMFVGKC
jgi:hypothetical protein